VGDYLLVAIFNRCVAPCSKVGYRQVVSGHAPAPSSLISIAGSSRARRFWENMDRVTRQAIKSIERDITIQMVRDFDIDLKRVLFDGTNFFTFIDTFNERSTLAQRGKNKEGRRALRIVGLALLVSADFHVPLFHRTYPGNQVDAPTFSSLTEELVSRYREITNGAQHVTIIFDKGNNSQDNLQAIEESPYHFIGSLVPTQHPDLLGIPAREFRALDEEGLPGVRVYRCQKEVFKAQRTILVTYNENLFVAQSRTLLREIAKRQTLLRQLQHQLRRHQEGKVRKGSPPTMEGVSKKVQWLAQSPPHEGTVSSANQSIRRLAKIDLSFRQSGMGAIANNFARKDNPLHRQRHLERCGDRPGVSQSTSCGDRLSPHEGLPPHCFAPPVSLD
jgi:hypothetical protein